jgi:hypothetical protein
VRSVRSGEIAGAGAAERPLVVRGASAVGRATGASWWLTLLAAFSFPALRHSLGLGTLVVAVMLLSLAKKRWLPGRDRPRIGDLVLDERRISLGGALLLHVREVTDAYRVADGAGDSKTVAVRVVARRGVGFEVTLEHAKDARAVLRKLGKDASLTTVTYRGAVKELHHGSRRPRLVGPIDVIVFGITALFVGLIAVTPRVAAPERMLLAVPAVLMTVFLALLAISSLRNRDVTVGTDGISIGKGAAARFLAWAQITSVAREDNDVTLTVRDRGAIVFTPSRASQERNPAESFVQHAAEARKAKRGAELRADLGPLLARGGRDAAEWMHAVEEVAGSERGYRVATFTRDEVWRAALDPAADGDTRAGAVLALRRGLDDADRTRLRHAAQACAAPKLRTLMERVIDDDEPALRELLEEAEDPAPEKRAQARQVTAGK